PAGGRRAGRPRHRARRRAHRRGRGTRAAAGEGRTLPRVLARPGRRRNVEDHRRAPGGRNGWQHGEPIASTSEVTQMPWRSDTFTKTDPDAPAGFFATEAGGLRWLDEAHGARIVRVRTVSETALELERIDEAMPAEA